MHISADATLPNPYRPAVTLPVALAPLLVDEVTACKLLGGISRRKLFGLREEGLPYARLNRRVLYSLSALQNFVDEKLAEVKH